ncbi:TraR/DksA C4-type zinc finger protein [Halomonas denitrificans]|uniref:TraR/DksA C4-type zinc finger protein n=1 Tax=Halomonas denitrificans TaxID=370769 RepID=UPI001C99C286|nr:TraR/DksA C4-type zinc finger protein [Halomonas denitrificans]MBY5969888.1 TraR/DksA C4-type zinc finger protein [Halomonas denitrificans]
MADNADIATEIQERHLEGALANRTSWIGIDWATPLECQECGDEIPEARRQAAPWATNCIGCQQINERKSRHVR